MSEELSEANPHGVYREEDDPEDQGHEDVPDQEVENPPDSIVVQADAIPPGMEWMQEAFASMQGSMQAQFNTFTLALMQNLPNMVKQEFDKQRPESLRNDEVQASMLNELSNINSNLNDLKGRVSLSEHLGNQSQIAQDEFRQLHNKELAEIKFDQHHMLNEIRHQSESAERESHRVYARFDSLEKNLPQMVAEVLAARPEAAPNEVVPDQAQGSSEGPPRVRHVDPRVQGRPLHLVEESVMRPDQNITRRKGQQAPFPNDMSGAMVSWMK